MSLRARDVLSAIGYPSLLGAAVVSVLRNFGGAGAASAFAASPALLGSSRLDSAYFLLVPCAAGVLLVLLQGTRLRAAVAWQCLLLAAWSDDDTSLRAGGQASLDARMHQRATQLEWQGRTVVAARFVNLQLLGCWLYSFAVREINARRSVLEGSQFSPSPNILPWFLHSMNASTIALWLVWWLFKVKQQASIDWNRRQLVRLRLLSITPADNTVGGDPGAVAAREATDQYAAEWDRATKSTEKTGVANAVLLPESAGPCGLKSPLRPVVIVGNGVVFGCKPVAEYQGRSSPTQQHKHRKEHNNQQLENDRPKDGGVSSLGELRDCAIGCQAGWCIVDTPRLGAVHCALFRQQGTSNGFVLYDFSAPGCYLNGAPLRVAPALGRGRQVQFGDRISLTVCASPHAEICYTLLPADAASWEWVSRAVVAERATVHSVHRPPHSSTASAHAAAPGSAEEYQHLVEQISALQQRQLSYSAQRRTIILCLLLLAVVSMASLAYTIRVLDCTVLQYVGILVRAIQRPVFKEVGKLHVDEALLLIQPVSILFLWWVLYSFVVAVALLGGWYFLCRAEGSCASECLKAEHQLSERLARRSPRDGSATPGTPPQSDVSHEDETWETQAQLHGLRKLDAVLSQQHASISGNSATADHDALAQRLSAAMRNCVANGVASTAAARYTAPHELGLEELRCPISLAQMSAAVTVLPCGHVFDRPSLVAYIASANKSAALARCPFGCECTTMTVVANVHIRKAVRDACSRSDTAGKAAVGFENGDEEGTDASAAHQAEYGDDEAVAAIYGSVQMREAYRALLTDRALPAVFECDGARTRKVDSLLLHLEGLGWYNPRNHPLADAKTRDIAIGKLQAMLQALLPVDSSQHAAHRLLQPSRGLVILTQILRRILHSAEILAIATVQEALLGDLLQPTVS